MNMPRMQRLGEIAEKAGKDPRAILRRLLALERIHGTKMVVKMGATKHARWWVLLEPLEAARAAMLSANDNGHNPWAEVVEQLAARVDAIEDHLGIDSTAA